MNKIIISCLCIIALLLSSCSSEYKVKSYVVEVKEELPIYLGSGMTLIDVGIEENNLIWVIDAAEIPVGLFLDVLNDPIVNRTAKNSVLDYFDLSECDEVRDLLKNVVDSNYSLELRISCESLGNSTEMIFKPYELRALCTY